MKQNRFINLLLGIVFLFALLPVTAFSQGRDSIRFESKEMPNINFLALAMEAERISFERELFAVGYSCCEPSQCREQAIFAMFNNVEELQRLDYFGGDGMVRFISGARLSDGVVVGGFAEESSFGTGDLMNMTGRGGYDAIALQFDTLASVLWKRNVGGEGFDIFNSITTANNHIFAVGVSSEESFGNGDFVNRVGRGGDDATIASFDLNGNLLWVKNFGGSGDDAFNAVVPLSDGILVAGFSAAESFANGDWASITGNGEGDAIMVKFDFNGNVVWKSNFGGASNDYFASLTAVSDGIVAVGFSAAKSFNTGDWTGIEGNGDEDAIIVKFDTLGNVVWKSNFGGAGNDRYVSAVELSDGIAVVGHSGISSFGNGNWTDFSTNNAQDAIIVKYNHNGEVLWKENFGDGSVNSYTSVMAVAGGIMATGYSEGEPSGKSFMVKYEDTPEPPSYVTLYGTLFPFVYENDPAFDTLFKYTIRLYDVPPPSGGMETEVILAGTPLYTTTSTYYDGSVYISGTPKYPGEIGRTNVFGLPIFWDWAGLNPALDPPNLTTLSGPGDKPIYPVGMYRLENVENNRDYILRISRPGYLDRFGKITVTESGTLGHRYIIPGDLDGTLDISIYDISKINQASKRVCLPNPNFDPGYDLNGDACVNSIDNTIILYYMNMGFWMYQETYDWITGY